MDGSIRNRSLDPQASRVGSPPRAAWVLALGSIGVSALAVLAIALRRGLHPISATVVLTLIAAACVLVILTLLVPWAAPGIRRWSRFLIGTALATAGVLHLLLVPEHAKESTLLGYGFLAAGGIQLLLALLFWIRPAPLAAYAVVGLNAALLFLYLVHVYLGLPLSSAQPRAALGTREEIDLPGLVSKIAEVVSLVLALVILALARRERATAQSGLNSEAGAQG